MDHDFLSQVFERGGVEAVTAALEDFASRATHAGLDAAVDLTCQVIAEDTARTRARGDQAAALVKELAAQAADLEWQINMLVGFTAGEFLDLETDPDNS
ncbi:hypothetical protein [Streptomyces sp. DSM 40484]|uniref:hypothetical protein n=1 Tax=Streptomyces kroppenstedtii TaxID=3051181 RepID=UPI0028D8018E|nr:hypothetical protein [Streptomyces sp. DSM 40484]